MLRRVALVRTDVSDEFSAATIRVTRIDELGTTLAITINLKSYKHFLVYEIKEIEKGVCTGRG
jgi:hypothetical protein